MGQVTSASIPKRGETQVIRHTLFGETVSLLSHRLPAHSCASLFALCLFPFLGFVITRNIVQSSRDCFRSTATMYTYLVVSCVCKHKYVQRHRAIIYSWLSTIALERMIKAKARAGRNKKNWNEYYRECLFPTVVSSLPSYFFHDFRF